MSATDPPENPATLTERSDRLHRTITALFALAEAQNDRQVMGIPHARQRDVASCCDAAIAPAVVVSEWS